MIKHLSPKSRNEIEESLLNLPNSLEKIKLLNQNFIEVTKKEATQIFNGLPVRDKIDIALKKNSRSIIKKIIKNNPELTFYDIHDVILWSYAKEYKDIYNALVKKIHSSEKISIGSILLTPALLIRISSLVTRFTN